MFLSASSCGRIIGVSFCVVDGEMGRLAMITSMFVGKFFCSAFWCDVSGV